MDFLLNSLSDLLERVAGGTATMCAFLFFEPEVPKSLREE